MRVLGITDMQTSGAAIVENTEIVVAVNEERLVRKKMARGFPRASIKKVFELSGLSADDIDAVAIAQINGFFSNEVLGWRGWFEERAASKNMHSTFFKLAANWGWIAGYFPLIRNIYYWMRFPAYHHRRKLIKKILREEFGIKVPILYYHHHFCHATAAHFASGFDESLTVTMDGGGDGNSSHIYSVKEGKFQKLNEVGAYDSLGNYYAYITAICGYKAKKHEGKITGLAAHGNPVYLDLLKKFIKYESGKTRNIGKVLFNSAISKLKESFPEDVKKEDLAASIQALSEEVARNYVQYWLKKTGRRDVALAGGLFANVRINEEIHNLPEAENVFIYPGMSDEGLAVGAALAYVAENAGPEILSDSRTQIPNVYMGPEFSDEEIRQALEKDGLTFSFHENIEKEIGKLLAENHVVARFNGKMEYGPRALGNRSILYQPNDPSVNDWLNKNLKRTEFMPFAPSVLGEHADKCFLNLDGSTGTARFMTITFHCTDFMKENCGGVVHLDGTARPQLVFEKDNPSYYNIIKAYYQQTGIPVIINTSFNIHEEPIVCSPEDAIRAFKIGHLDYLAIGNFLVKNHADDEKIATRMKRKLQTSG